MFVEKEENFNSKMNSLRIKISTTAVLEDPHSKNPESLFKETKEGLMNANSQIKDVKLLVWEPKSISIHLKLNQFMEVDLCSVNKEFSEAIQFTEMSFFLQRILTFIARFPKEEMTRKI